VPDAAARPASASVERVELAPLDPTVMPSAASAPPPVPPGTATPAMVTIDRFGTDLWRGLDMKALEDLIVPLSLPPHSATLQGLWRRLLVTDATAPSGTRGPGHFPALRLEALYRSGLIAEMEAIIDGGDPTDTLIQAFAIRRALAAGRIDEACGATRALTARRSEVPKLLQAELHLLAGYCAAVGGNPAAAGLAAELAREAEVDAPLALAALDAIAANQGVKPATPPNLPAPKRLVVLDYRLMEQLGPVDLSTGLDKAEPALLVALADAKASPRLAVFAAEAASGLGALPPTRLADAYKAAPGASSNDGTLRRAALYKQIAGDNNPQRQLATMRQLLDDARKSALSMPVARALAGLIPNVPTAQDVSSNAETAIEISLAAGDFDRARAFAGSNPATRHWLALIELADPRSRRGPALDQALDDLARRGGLSGNALHRVATVLDALDVNVPLPLWEAAGRAPQPKTGHLPETGVLPQLQQAAKQREVGRTVLLVLRTLGPSGPEGAHQIALGDSLRALRRAGLDADARALALEALLPVWPRSGA
jgi:hypothetical protein